MLIFYGRNASFFLIHQNHHAFADYFFWLVTYLGDGLIFVPFGLYCIFFRRDFLVPLIAGIILSTLFTHLLKRVIFPEELRPVSLEMENMTLRRVLGLKLHRMNSFPSGHTATAFTAGLLFVQLVQSRIATFVVPILAFLVAYSRVYLGQHFVADILVGASIGILSAWLALMAGSSIRRRWGRKTSNYADASQAS
jgi:membrane-associated phospholipid phosphatase